MKFLAFAVVPFILAQVPSCDKLPEGNIEYKDCEVADEKVGFTCKALYVGGQLVRKVYTEVPKPSPSSEVPASPVPSPINSPSPVPSNSPSPIPSISPSPVIGVPVPGPICDEVNRDFNCYNCSRYSEGNAVCLEWKLSTKPTSDFYCTVQPDGFYPTPPLDQCPPCWKNNPDVIGYWGIGKGGDRKCTGVNCGCGKVLNVHMTPHSTDDKFLRHRYDFEKQQFSGSETHKGCQPAEDSKEIPEIWVYPPNDVPGLCDPFSGSRYWCHHKARAGTCGKTKFEVRQPPFKSITLDTN